MKLVIRLRKKIQKTGTERIRVPFLFVKRHLIEAQAVSPCGIEKALRSIKKSVLERARRFAVQQAEIVMSLTLGERGVNAT